MIKAVLPLCLLLYTCLAAISAKAQPTIEIQLKLNPSTKTFACAYTITSETSESLTLHLPWQHRITGIRGKHITATKISAHFDPFTKDSLQQVFIGFKNKAAAKATINYSGTIPAHACKNDVVELSAHTGWLPLLPDREYALVKYTLEVQVDKTYKIVSTGAPTKYKRGQYTFTGTAPNIEITALAAKAFYTLQSPSVAIVKANAAPTAPDSALLSEAENIIAYYNQAVGRQDAISNFTVFLPQTNRNAYALLNNAAVITYADFDVENMQDKTILAHEISHKWWAYGNWKSYENWLNEAFASYTALLYVRHTGDTAAFDQAIDKHAKNAKNTPAILSFQPSQHDYAIYSKVIYDKGTFILYKLHNRIGNEAFLKILSTAAANKIASTEAFLELVCQQAGHSAKVWLYRQLQK